MNCPNAEYGLGLVTSPEQMRKTCLVVIDGWGVSPCAEASHPNLVRYDAIANAKTPNMTRLAESYPSTQLEAHGTAVGLPEGLMGNSEVGHLNIGAGRIVYQDIVRIDKTIEQETMCQQEALKDVLDRTRSHEKSRLHFIGLVSDGGVHSHIQHLYALLRLAKKHLLPSQSVYIHFIADGRDTSPKSATGYLEQLWHFIEQSDEMYGRFHIATITGRYYAMDRDKRWERTKMAYDAYISGMGDKLDGKIELATVIGAMEAKYQNGETDEFFKPLILSPDGIIKKEDFVVFFNYRSDRMRQIVSSMIDSCQDMPVPFERQQFSAGERSHIYTMTQYAHSFTPGHLSVIFPPQSMDNVLAEWISSQGLKQCHLAETEKYAHVTFFFNGGREVCFPGEDRVLVPSPKVLTYDLMPEMSVNQVGQSVIERIRQGEYAFVMCNLAPPDMVGHTGKYAETLQAVEATDRVIGEIWEACKKNNYVLFVTADHGNAEKMMDEQDRPHTAHTTAPVPFIVADPAGLIGNALRPGALCDVAPTILAVMGISAPSDMNGKSLLK